MSINFENISLLVSGCMDLLANKSVLRSYGPIWTHEHKFWKYFTFGLRLHGPIGKYKVCSGCMDLYDHHFVLRLHRPIRLPFCTQSTWTYMIAILCSGCMDLYDHHIVLRLHRPVRFPFCARATWSYMITILCSGCMDLYDHDYKHFMSINFENISLFVSGCMDLLANKVCSGCIDLFGLSWI